MNQATQLADAMLKVNEHRRVVNAKAKSLVAECAAFMKGSDEDVLGGDIDYVIRLATDLMEARREWRMALDTAEALKRRAQ